MPNNDGTGPMGKGPQTGKMQGSCVGRPKKARNINFSPNAVYFKPQGIPMRELEEVVIESDEVEALKLHDLDNLDQTLAAEKMQISQSTFARLLDSCYKKIADGLLNGKAIRLDSEPACLRRQGFSG